MKSKNIRCAKRITQAQFLRKQSAILKNAMREIMSASFMVRLKFCWMVIKGVK